MKLYPSFHRIEETERIRPGDIPLSYIATDKINKEIRIRKNKEASRPQEETAVMPYESFKVRDPYLFDSLGQRVELSSMMQRIGDLYYFIPKNAVEFKPQEFSFSMLYKRDITFVNDKKYNFRVGCLDSSAVSPELGGPMAMSSEPAPSVLLSESLISIFGDAPRRGLSPSNISVNSQEMARESLFDISLENTDMLFIQSENGIHFEGTEIPYDDILDANINLWISVGELGESIYDAEGPYTYGTATLYDDPVYDLPGYGKAFDLFKIPEKLKKYREYIVFRGDSPILILESPMKGFIVFSEKGLLENAGAHHKFIYEIMSTILFGAYTRTPQKTIWITDSVIDHIGSKETEYGYAHETVSISELIGKDEIPPGEEYSLLGVETSSPDITFRGHTREGIMLFQKNQANPDPTKEHGMVSVYTTRGTIMLYKKDNIFKVEKDLDIKAMENAQGYYLEITPYKSSSLRIYTEETQKIAINPGQKPPWILACKDNIFHVKEAHSYSETNDGIQLAVIDILFSSEKEHHDMRVQGGGLMESAVDDYDLLDISSIEGRPYREGGALSIRLPKRLTPHKEKIEKAIGRHISSGDIPIIIFE